MMTLTAAINSGKKFARSGDADVGEFFSKEDFLGGGLSLEDYNATDYVVEPDAVAVTIKETILIEAWNATKPEGTGAATASPFYRRLKAALATRGITISA